MCKQILCLLTEYNSGTGDATWRRGLIWLCSVILISSALVSVDVIHSLRLATVLKVLPLLRHTWLMLPYALPLWLCSTIVLCPAVVSVDVVHPLRLATVLKVLPLLGLHMGTNAWLRYALLILTPTILLLWAEWRRLQRHPKLLTLCIGGMW